MATDSLFILSPFPPVGSQSISRDLERERETEDKSFGGRRRHEERERKDRAEHGDLSVLPVGLWPHIGRQMLMGSFRDLLCDFGPLQLIL